MCGTHLTQRSSGMSFHAVWQVGTVFCVVIGPAACGYRSSLCKCWRNPKLNIRITKTKQKHVTNAFPTCTYFWYSHGG